MNYICYHLSRMYSIFDDHMTSYKEKLLQWAHSAKCMSMGMAMSKVMCLLMNKIVIYYLVLNHLCSCIMSLYDPSMSETYKSVANLLE
jgi:predicted Co/Zn/Cd cation transporter (cation efflux family)